MPRAIDMGCWFSVGPGMLLSKHSRELVSLIPLDRILTETDGPFAGNNDRGLKPGEVEMAYETLSRCFNINSNEIVELIFSAFKRLIFFQVGGPKPDCPIAS